MILFIDTTNQQSVKLALLNKAVVWHEFQAHDLSEVLLLEIKKFFRKQKVDFNKLTKIAVVVGPGGFSRVRTAVATANALAFGLKIELIPLKISQIPQDLLKLAKLPVQKMAEPFYDRQPNITMPKKK